VQSNYLEENSDVNKNLSVARLCHKPIMMTDEFKNTTLGVK